MKNNIYIPIETKSREYYGKLLLACYLADSGFKVYIGERDSIFTRIPFLKSGIIIEKGIGYTGLKRNKWLKDLGNILYAWDEEGFVFDENRYKKHTSLEMLNKFNKIFCWNERQKNIILKEFNINKNNLIITGNPRFDILKEKYADNLFKNNKLEKYILINTNFSLYNNITESNNYLEKYKKVYIDNLKISENEKDKLFNNIKKYYNLQKEKFFDFSGLIQILSKNYPNIKFVLRPHPTESVNRWKQELKKLNNVEVIYEGDANKWIYNSLALIHESCTTGVQAYFMNKPVIAYKPNNKKSDYSTLPNDISLKANNKNEVISILNNILENKNEKISKTIDKYYYDENNNACELITKQINNDFKNKKIKNKFLINKFFHKLTIIKIIKIIFNIYNVPKQKFPGIFKDEIIGDIKKYSNTHKSFNNINTKIYLKNKIFILEK